MISQKKQSLPLLGIPLVLLSIVLITACPSPVTVAVEETPSVSFTALTANGEPNAETTTELTLTFSEDPGNLRLSQLSVTGATKSILSGSGTTRTLTINNITVPDGKSVTVSVIKQPSGYRIDPPSRSVAVNVAPPVIRFVSLECSGSSRYQTSTILMFKFDASVGYLNPANFQIEGASLNSYFHYIDGGFYQIGIRDITVKDGELITVTLPEYLNGARIEPRTRSAPVWIGTDTVVLLRSLTANGESNYQTTDTLTLDFYGDPKETLTAERITLTGATLVNVTADAPNYTYSVFKRKIAIKDITVANGEEITLDITPTAGGISIFPVRKTVQVYKRLPDVAFTGLEANGASNTQTTTELTLSFDKNPQGLTMDDIELVGATKVALSGTGAERILEIRDLGVFNGQSVTVRLADITSDCFFSPSERSIPVWIEPTAVQFVSAVSNGTPGTVTTTEIALTFDRNPETLTLADITVTGARLLGMTGTAFTRTLLITEIGGADGSQVEVSLANPVRYSISPLNRSVTINKAPPIPVDFTTLTANGTPGKVTTTELTLDFSANPATLALKDITVIGARATGLSGTGTSRTLTVTDIPILSGTITVRLENPYGYSFTTTERTVTPNRFAIPMAFIPGGKFQRDATAANISEVTGFLMSTHEITAEQYMEVTKRPNPNASFTSMVDAPVQLIEWHDAIAFCNLLSEREGLTPVYSMNGSPVIAGKGIVTADWNANGYRLPTEMEWMWAAMGGSSDSRPGAVSGEVNATGYSKAFSGSNGSNAIGSYAWYPAPSTLLSPVGQKLPNELGLYDMSGNVAELTWDSYGEYPAGVLTNYRGTETWNNAKVSRGGSFGHFQTDATIAYRMEWDINSKGTIQGFRVARNAE